MVVSYNRIWKIIVNRETRKREVGKVYRICPNSMNTLYCEESAYRTPSSKMLFK